MSTVVERLNAALRGRYRIEREIGEGGMAPVWPPAGDEIFYGTQRGWMVARIDTREGFRVVTSTEILWPSPAPVNSAVAGGWFDLSPDGRRILAVRPATTDGKTSVVPELILVQNFLEELKARVPN